MCAGYREDYKTTDAINANQINFIRKVAYLKVKCVICVQVASPNSPQKKHCPEHFSSLTLGGQKELRPKIRPLVFWVVKVPSQTDRLSHSIKPTDLLSVYFKPFLFRKISNFTKFCLFKMYQ